MLTTMDEGRKRGLAIVAGILVARHLKTAEDLAHASRPFNSFNIPQRPLKERLEKVGARYQRSSGNKCTMGFP